jgi:hypothetical protein
MFIGSNPDSNSALTKEEELQKVLAGDVLGTVGQRLENAYDPAKLRKETISLDEAFGEVIKTMGRGTELSESLKENLAQGTIEILDMGGSLEDAKTIQDDLMASTNKNLIATKEEIKEIFAVTDTLGVGFSALNSALLDVGKSTKDVSEFGVITLETSKKLGVNAATVSSLVVSNMSLLNRYGFEKGIEGLSRMAAKASALRVDMSTISQLADKLLSPEKSIEFSNTLSNLGITATNLTNPLASMNLAQNDVGALTDEIGNALSQFVEFNEETKSFEIPPFGRGVFKEFSEQTGMQIDQIEKLAIGTKTAQRVLDEISFDSFSEIDDDTQTAIANLAKMNKEGKYEIVTKEGKTKELQDFLDDFGGNTDALKEAVQGIEVEKDKTYEDKMLEYNEKQMTYTEKMANALVGIEKKPQELYAKSDIAELQLQAGETLVSTAKEGADIPYEALNQSMENSNNLSDFLGNLVNTIPTKVKAGLADMTSRAGQGYLDIANKQKGEDVLKYPGGEIEFLKQDTILSLTNGPEFIQGLKNIKETITSLPQNNIVNNNNNIFDFTEIENIFGDLSKEIVNLGNNLTENTPKEFKVEVNQNEKTQEFDFDTLSSLLGKNTQTFDFNKFGDIITNSFQNLELPSLQIPFQNIPVSGPEIDLEKLKLITEQVTKNITETNLTNTETKKEEKKITLDVNLNTNGADSQVLKNALNNQAWISQLRQGISNSVYNDNTDVGSYNINNRTIF